MTIPWLDQSSPSFQNSEPVCCEPVKEEEITPSTTERSQPEFSNIHPERNSGPPKNLKELEGEITSSYKKLTPFPCFKTSERSQVNSDGIFAKHLKRRYLDVDGHFQRSGKPYKILTCPSFACFETFKFRNLLSVSQKQFLFITEKSSWRKSVSHLRFSRLALIASLVLLCLLVIDAENSHHKQNNRSKGIVPIKVFSDTYCLPWITGSLIRKRLQQKEVWIDPKRGSRTVGKHRCHCTKNSFFMSNHNTSDSYNLLYPVLQDCNNQL